MKKYKAILFDMDGTLVPMDMNQFTSGYFKELWKKLAHLGFEPKELESAIWTGTGAMVKNDGSRPNKEAFWETFEKITGKKAVDVDPLCIDFYSNEFKEAKQFTLENPLAKEAVRLAHEKAEHVILATNPIFPMVGQITRMSWVGLTPDDFEFVTSYETSTSCKPNPQYFLDVCAKAGVDPKDCLMVGNDENEDMYAASQTGMDTYLVTDTAIPSKEHPYSGPKGNFKELIEFFLTM